MRWFARPPGRFDGEFVCALKAHYGAKAVTSRTFGFWDGSLYWRVPRNFVHDGASFPWWLRWIPSIVAVLILAVDGGTLRAIVYPALLQWLVGWPLEPLVREAAGVHDFGYKWGFRPKWMCDRAFFRALWQRIWLNYEAGTTSAAGAWLQLVRAGVWTGVVFLAGFGAWWGHRRRDRRKWRERARGGRP